MCLLGWRPSCLLSLHRRLLKLLPFAASSFFLCSIELLLSPPFTTLDSLFSSCHPRFTVAICLSVYLFFLLSPLLSLHLFFSLLFRHGDILYSILCSVNSVPSWVQAWIRSISATTPANLQNRNAWRPNCFSFETSELIGELLRVSRLSIFPFAAREAARVVPFHATGETIVPTSIFLSIYFLDNFGVVVRMIWNSELPHNEARCCIKYSHIFTRCSSYLLRLSCWFILV